MASLQKPSNILILLGFYALPCIIPSGEIRSSRINRGSLILVLNMKNIHKNLSNKKLAVTSAIVLLTTGTAIFAHGKKELRLEDMQERIQDAFSHHDENSDGFLSQEEFEDSRLSKRNNFQKLDKDGDSVVSKQELQDFTAARFAVMDRDADGIVNKEEMKQYQKEQMFERLDTNQDGSISKEEFESAKAWQHGKKRHKHKYW